ncbi:MAG: hypothetical protein ACLGI6_19685 [Gammaproteobacteria bacterium]
MTAAEALQMETKIELAQRRICANHGARFEPCADTSTVEVAGGLRDGQYPIHGWRREGAGKASGWFIWSGDTGGRMDTFFPLQVGHLRERAPITLPFLALGPGWRFMVTADDIQIWEGDQAP